MIKSILSILFFNVLMTTHLFAQDIKPLSIGANIPMSDVKIKGTDKKEYQLKKLTQNSGLIVVFTCNTCPYVIKSQMRTKELIDKAREAKINIVFVNSNEANRSKEDSEAEMEAYMKSQAITAPYLIDKDSKLANAFGATRTPEVFFFGPDGKLVYHGAMEDNPTNPSESTAIYIFSAIRNVMQGILPEPAETKSIGCTIKRK